MIEDFLEKESTYFSGLGATVIIVGSSVEGTRIGILDEADCMLRMKTFKPEYFALVDESATVYQITEAGKREIPSDFIDASGNLNYLNFLECLLSDLSRFFADVSLPTGMSVNSQFKMCPNCGKEEGLLGHMMHCKECRPVVTFTRAGPCCLLDDEGTIVSIDLIPLLPCPQPDPIAMFNKVTSSLVKGDLSNWLPYLKKFVKTDSLLPEVLGSPTIPEDGYTAFKLLHAQSDRDQFILRPGQTLAMSSLQEKRLKETYCFLKALKVVMTLRLSSYSLKKVLLLEDFMRHSKLAQDEVDLLYTAINHLHFKSFFEDEFEAHDRHGKWKIDWDAWQDKMEEFLKMSQTERNADDSGYYRIPLERA